MHANHCTRAAAAAGAAAASAPAAAATPSAFTRMHARLFRCCCCMLLLWPFAAFACCCSVLLPLVSAACCNCLLLLFGCTFAQPFAATLKLSDRINFFPAVAGTVILQFVWERTWLYMRISADCAVICAKRLLALTSFLVTYEGSCSAEKGIAECGPLQALWLESLPVAYTQKSATHVPQLLFAFAANSALTIKVFCLRDMPDL